MGSFLSSICIDDQTHLGDPRSSTTRLHQTGPPPAERKDLWLEKACHVDASPRPRLQPFIPTSDSRPGEHVPSHPSIKSQRRGKNSPYYQLGRVLPASSRLTKTSPLRCFMNDCGSNEASRAACRLLHYGIHDLTPGHKYCVFYLALSLHPLARHISYQPQFIESKWKPSNAPRYCLWDCHLCLTTEVTGKECLFPSTEMQTRARNMISLLWLIGHKLDDHDRSTLLTTAFFDGFRAAHCIIKEKFDVYLGNEVYAALSSTIVQWSYQLLEIPSSRLYPFHKNGCALPNVDPPQSVDQFISLDTLPNEAGTSKFNVKHNYLDMLNPPFDSFTAVPATEHTRFIVERLAEDFHIGEVSLCRHGLVKWTVNLDFDDNERAFEAAQRAARQSADETETEAAQRAVEAATVAHQRASEAKIRQQESQAHEAMARKRRSRLRVLNR